MVIVYLLILFFLLYFLCLNKTEGVENVSAASTTPTEAIQNLSSMYNQEKLVVKNMDMTGDIHFPKGNQWGENWIKSTGNLVLNSKSVLLNPAESTIISKTSGGSGNLHVEGNSHVNGNLTVSGNMSANNLTANFGQRRGDDSRASDIDFDSGGGEKDAMCPANQYVCGVHTKHWLNSRSNMNNSGIIGLTVHCCKFN